MKLLQLALAGRETRVQHGCGLVAVLPRDDLPAGAAQQGRRVVAASGVHADQLVGHPLLSA
jgi:hypothetical protein